MNSAGIVEIFGPSLATGYGTAGQEYGWGALVAAGLGAYEANYAANSLVLAHDGNGFAKYIRPALALRTRQAKPYVSPVDLVVLQLGLGDLANNMVSNGVVTPGAFRAAFDAILAFSGLAAFYNAEPAGASHSSIAYGGTWGDVAVTDRNTGAGVRNTLTVGSTLTLTVPADYPGTEIVLFWPVGALSGGTIRIIADGPRRYGFTETITAQDTDQVTAAVAGFKATHLTGMVPGAYTITATVTAITGFGIAFDGWGIRAVNPPPVVALAQPRLTPANFEAWLGPFAGDTPNDATIRMVNQHVAQLAEAAGASYLTLEDLHLDPARWTFDGAHLNEAGQARWASQILRHVDTLDRERRSPSRPLIPATFAANWGNDTTPYAPVTYTPCAPRQIRLAGRAKRTGTPSTGETIATLPEGLRPAATASFIRPGSTGTPTVTIDATGAIKYAAGSLGASGTIDLDGIEITAKAIS